MPTTGMVLGKFMPPHAGHVYLVEFARAYVDRLTVVVGTLAREPIPGALRHRWMRELFPDVDVVHLTDELPQDPSEHPRFWDLWRDALTPLVPRPLDHVFASEPYGQRLAEELSASFVPVDLSRAAVPMSGTRVREDPMAHWAYIPRVVRPYFARRICVFGPESTGKSTLAAELARRFDTVWVPEYARTYLEWRKGDVALGDMPAIARGQIAAERALERNANRLLICDTDVLTTSIWSDVLFGSCPQWIREEADRRTYDLYLLTDVDVPFVPDIIRYLPEERRSFFDRCRGELERRNRPHIVLTGSWEERLATATAAVESVLARHG